MYKLKKIRNILFQFEVKIIVILCVLLLSVVTIEIVLRYLKLPLYWSEEIARYIYVYMIMFGCVIGVEQKTHYNVDIIVRLLTKKYRRLTVIISNILSIVFLSAMFYEGIVLCVRTKNATTPALGMPQYYAYAAIPLGALLMLSHLFIQIMEDQNLERNSD